MSTLLTVWLSTCCVLVPNVAADPELAGNWVGQIDTTRGSMEIGLELRLEQDTLTGVLKTAHGDWAITGVTQEDGVWTVRFKSAGNEGRLIGRVENNRFAGDWKSTMADGTFEMARARKKPGRGPATYEPAGTEGHLMAAASRERGSRSRSVRRDRTRRF